MRAMNEYIVRRVEGRVTIKPCKSASASLYKTQINKKIKITSPRQQKKNIYIIF